MNQEPLDALRALNPARTSTAPPIDQLWRRLDAAADPSAEAGPAVQPKADGGARRARTWGSRALAAISVAIVVAIAVGAIVVLQPTNSRSFHPAGAGQAAALTRILGVLRQPQTAADRKVKLPLLLTRSPARPHAAAPSPIRSLIRVAAPLAGGQHVSLIPVVVHRPTASGLPSQRYELAQADGGGASCCVTPQQIENGQAFSSFGGTGKENVGVLIVPDGVARVRVGTPQPVTVAVHNNVAVIQTTADLENLDRYAMTWSSQTGTVLKRFASGRTVNPTHAQDQAIRRQALRIAEQRKDPTRPDIRLFYPVFDAGFSPSSAGSGVIAYTLSNPTVSQLPTNALTDAGTVPKYAVNARNERLLHVGTGLKLWLAAGGRICFFGRSEKNTTCTPEGTPRAGLVTAPPVQPRPKVVVALVPHNNPTVVVNTTTGSRTVPVHDDLVVLPAAHVKSLQFKNSNGQTITRRP
jgi:hypothetical protein